MLGVELLSHWDVKIAFSPSGHGLMTLIVSFLVVNKVNLAFGRYMDCRHAIGHALSALRELNQSALQYTFALPPSIKRASEWRRRVSNNTATVGP
jgi:predicted membrane chloride channel (bestrophin family)